MGRSDPKHPKPTQTTQKIAQMPTRGSDFVCDVETRSRGWCNEVFDLIFGRCGSFVETRNPIIGLIASGETSKPIFYRGETLELSIATGFSDRRNEDFVATTLHDCLAVTCLL